MPYAIITGATQGIGKAIAEHLLAQGCSIAVCARNKEKLKLLEWEWNDLYPAASIVAVAADISEPAGAALFTGKVLEVFPEIDIVINNAGAFLPGNIADEPAGRLEALIGANLYSAYYITRQVLPLMKAGGRGHIFNMCSVASLKAYPNGGAYSISKYALLGFSENLREELRESGIKVTSVCPGATYTPSWEGSGVTADRIMEAADIAQMVWAAYNLSAQANVDTLVLRPVKGDL